MLLPHDGTTIKEIIMRHCVRKPLTLAALAAGSAGSIEALATLVAERAAVIDALGGILRTGISGYESPALIVVGEVVRLAQIPAFEQKARAA